METNKISFSNYKKAHVLQLCKTLRKKSYRIFGSGNHRVVIGNDSIVVKIPLNNYGIIANRAEHKSYTCDKSHKAKCKMGQYKKLPIVLMESVDHGKFLDCPSEIRAKNKWILDLPDGEQVGINKKGELVCYDYADIDRKYYDLDIHVVNGSLEDSITEIFRGIKGNEELCTRYV